MDQPVNLSKWSRSGVPNLWPAGQKWPTKPLGVALDLSTKKNEIYVKN